MGRLNRRQRRELGREIGGEVKDGLIKLLFMLIVEGIRAAVERGRAHKKARRERRRAKRAK